MKRLSLMKTTLCLIVLSLFMSTNVSAGGAYDFPDYGFSIEIPSSYIVLTQDTTNEIACRNFFGFSAKDFGAFLKQNGVLFHAVVPSGNYTLTLRISEDSDSKALFNLTDIPDQYIEENLLQYPDQIEARLKDSSSSEILLLNSSIYHNNLSWIRYDMLLFDESSYCYQYLTVCNGYRITLSQKSFDGPLPDVFQPKFQAVCDSLEFDEILDNPNSASQSSAFNDFWGDISPFTAAVVTGLFLAIIALCLWEKKHRAEPMLKPDFSPSFHTPPKDFDEVPSDNPSFSDHFSPTHSPSLAEPNPPSGHSVAASSAPAPSPAIVVKEDFYSERFDFICNSVSTYIKSELKNEPHSKAFTHEIAAEVVFPLLLLAAVTALNDHDFEEYCFEALHQASLSLNKEPLYTNAVAHYNTFVDLYNSYSHDTKEVFASWQYKASQTVVQKIQGSTDPISPLSTVIFLMDFTKAYIKLQREQEAGTPVTASPLSPPPPDSLRDPSTLIKTPDTYVPLFCRKCGSVIPLDSIYCPECGEKVVVIR